jgi:hypothetical protein
MSYQWLKAYTHLFPASFLPFVLVLRFACTFSHSRNRLLSTVKQVCCQSIAQLTHLIPVPIACYPFLSFESFHPHFQTRTHTFKPVRVFGKPTLLILTVPDQVNLNMMHAMRCSCTIKSIADWETSQRQGHWHWHFSPMQVQCLVVDKPLTSISTKTNWKRTPPLVLCRCTVKTV